MPSTINIKELLSACVDLAEQAGGIIRQVHTSGDLQVQIKGYTPTGVEDPLTQADVKSQILIVDGLLSLWPDLKIIAEEDRVEHKEPEKKPNKDKLGDIVVPENLTQVPLQDVIVFIDPLDATREFTKGHVECVMTLIGIAVGGVPKAGVMYQPFVNNGQMFYGIVGAGVWGITPSEPHQGLVVATTASHSTEAVEAAIKSVNPDKVLRVGGAGYKALLILQGTADVYLFPTPGCKLWDTCAPQALLNAAGGTLTDAKGGKISYLATDDVNVTKGVLASKRNHEFYAKNINEHLK